MFHKCNLEYTIWNKFIQIVQCEIVILLFPFWLKVLAWFVPPTINCLCHIFYQMEISFSAAKKSYILPDGNLSLSLGEIFPPLRNCGSLAIAGHLPFSFALRKSTSMTRPPPKWQNILPRPTFEHSEMQQKFNIVFILAGGNE